MLDTDLTKMQVNCMQVNTGDVGILARKVVRLFNDLGLLTARASFQADEPCHLQWSKPRPQASCTLHF